jgi:hypothetical protein
LNVVLWGGNLGACAASAPAEAAACAKAERSLFIGPTYEKTSSDRDGFSAPCFSSPPGNRIARPARRQFEADGP